METTETTPLIAKPNNNDNNKNDGLPTQDQTTASTDESNDKAVEEEKEKEEEEDSTKDAAEKEEDLSHKAIFLRAFCFALFSCLVLLLISRTVIAYLFGENATIIDPFGLGPMFFCVGLLSGYARKYEYKMCEICGRAFWCKCGKKIEEVEDGEIGEKKGERVVTEKEDE